MSANSKFWLLGAAYWMVIAALVAAAFNVWPGLAGSHLFFNIAVLGSLAGGMVMVYLFLPRRGG